MDTENLTTRKLEAHKVPSFDITSLTTDVRINLNPKNEMG